MPLRRSCKKKTKEMDHLLGKITELQRQVVMKELLKKEVEGKGRDLFKQLLEKENEMSDLCSRVYELKKMLIDERCLKTQAVVKTYDDVPYLKEMLQERDRAKFKNESILLNEISGLERKVKEKDKVEGILHCEIELLER